MYIHMPTGMYSVVDSEEDHDVGCKAAELIFLRDHMFSRWPMMATLSGSPLH